MNKALQITMVIFFLHSVQSAGYIIQDYSELCSKQDYSNPKKFFQLPEKTQLSMSCDELFRSGHLLGKGSFGEVRRVTFPSADGSRPKTAMKKMSPRDSWEKTQILTEISALNAASDSKYTPRLYGCSTTSTNVYLIQTLLGHDLDSVSFRNKIAGQTCAESLGLYRQMFAGLRDLWNAGFVHNDIKPANMMANDDDTRVYLIDFGLAQTNNARNKGMGTPIFMPPSKFSGTGYVSQKDDMYSIALSIAVLEAPRSYDAIFPYGIRNYKGNCFEKHNDLICRNALIPKVKSTLQTAGYGSEQSSATKDTINFTTLLLKMVEYDNFSWSILDVIAIIDRLIQSDPSVKAKKALEEKEAARLAEQAKKAEELRKKLKENHRLEKEVQQDYEAAMKDEAAVILQAGLMGKKEGARDRLAAMEVEKANNLAKLDKLKLNEEFKRNELKKVEYQAREGSEIYNQNKALFKRQPIQPEAMQEEQTFQQPANLVEAPVQENKFQPVLGPKFEDPNPKNYGPILGKKVEDPTPKNKYNPPVQAKNEIANQPLRFKQPAGQAKVERNQIEMAGEYRFNPPYALDNLPAIKKDPSMETKEPAQDQGRRSPQQRKDDRIVRLKAKLVKNKAGKYPYFAGIFELVKLGYLNDNDIDWADPKYNGQYRIRI